MEKKYSSVCNNMLLQHADLLRDSLKLELGLTVKFDYSIGNDYRIYGDRGSSYDMTQIRKVKRNG